MNDIFIFITSCLCSVFIFYNIIPKSNPYKFPKANEIDKYSYVDNAGVCYKYRRKYL